MRYATKKHHKHESAVLGKQSQAKDETLGEAKRHYGALNQIMMIEQLRARQIHRRNVSLRTMKFMPETIKVVILELLNLCPGLTSESLSHHIIHYSRNGRLTAHDVLYKALAHAKADLPLPWDMKTNWGGS